MAIRPSRTSLLPAGSAIAGTELIGGVQGSEVSFTLAQVAAAVAGSQVLPSGQPTAVRVFQRDTRTGGAFSKGAGTITFSVTTLAPAATLEYRLRDAVSTGTVLVNWTQFATNVATGTATFTPSIPASANRYLLDVRANGYTAGASSGTQPFGVGEIVAGAGQSLLVNGFTTTLQAGNVDSGTTLASLGLTPNATSPVFASAAGQGNTVSNSSPTWAIPADSTFYGSSFAAQLLKDLSAALGVPCALIGHARGGFVIAGFQSGTPDGTQLRSVITAAGGKFGLFIWFQGHSDNATNGSGTPAPNSGYLSLANTLSGSALASGYQAALGTLISGLASTSSISFKTIICTIPALIATSGNSASGVFQVRSGAKAYAAASGGNAVVVDAVDATLFSDGTHWSQAGNVIGAHHMARAALGLLGLGDGDTGPTITSAIRGTVASGNQAKITLTVTNSSTASYPTPGLTTVGTATTQFQVFDSGTVTSPYTVSAVTIVDATHIQLTITSPPGDAGALDLYVRYPFDASSTVVSSGVYDTNTADGIGSTGRQLVIPAASVTVAAPNAVAPGNVTSLAAGTPTSSTIPVTYTAPSTGTTPFTYSGQTSPDNSTWTNNGGAFTGTGGTFTGLSASTAYYLRVVVSNGVNPNSTTNVPTNPVTTAASSPYPTISSATTVAHYDASLLSGAGTSIATLTDVANGNNLTGAGGSQPTVSTAGAQQINSKNVIVFTGSQKLTGGGGASSLGGNMSGIAVFKGTFNQGIIASLGASSNGGFGDQFWLQLGSTPSINITRAGTGGGQLSVAGGSSATLYKIIWRYTASTGLVEAWINGVYSSATHGTSAGSTWNQMVLGQINSTAGGFFYTGSIAEVWTFSGTLSGVANSASSGDVATLQSYMTSTWG